MPTPCESWPVRLASTSWRAMSAASRALDPAAWKSAPIAASSGAAWTMTFCIRSVSGKPWSAEDSTDAAHAIPHRRVGSADWKFARLANRRKGVCMGPIRFMVPGALVHEGRARLQAQRGAAEPTALVAVPGRHVVKLEIAGGPTLTLHPENARDLMLAQSGSASVTEGGEEQVTVPPRLRWKGFEQAAQARSARRGAVADAVLASVE